MNERVVLVRERFYGADDKISNIVKGQDQDPDGLELDLGLLPRDKSWWEVPLPPCPDCGGQLVWLEAGHVPGTRKCTGCGSFFSIQCHEERPQPAPGPEIFSFFCDNNHEHQLTEAQAQALNFHCPICQEPFV